GSLKLLHKDKDAEGLVDKFKMDNKTERSYEDFCQPLGTNSQYITVLAKQFPARLKKISANQFEQILKPIGDGQFNTLSAACAVQALKVYSHAIAQNPPQLTIAEVHNDKREVSLISAPKLLQRAQFSKDATAVRF